MVRNLKEVPTSLTNSTSSLNSVETIIKEQTERTVYLGDLDMETNEKQIQEYFTQMQIPVLKIVKQPHSSYAHVTFNSVDVAKSFLDKAIINLNNRVIRVMPFNQPNNFDPNANLIIKNLENYLNESDIIKKLKPFGDILSCKLVRDEKGESKCYAYLQFKEAISATEAIDKLNNTYWDEKCDPDYKYKKFQEKIMMFKNSSHLLGKLNESDFQESQLYADFSNKMGKKIYVGLFKKKNEYSKIKSDKEGRQSNLYVKNFGTNFGDRDLFNLFKTYGSIKSAKVRRLKIGMIEKPLGCGFVDFENPDEAEAARVALDGYALQESGRVISVTYADCKSRRMRKKLEESESDNKQVLLQKETEQPSVSEPMNQMSPSMYDNVSSSKAEFEESSVSLDNVNEEFENRVRKMSISSESSDSMSTSSVYNDLWSRILGTTVWSPYKLFDETNYGLFN